MNVYLEPAHVDKELHERAERKYVEVADEATLEASSTDQAGDQVDIHGQRHNLRP